MRVCDSFEKKYGYSPQNVAFTPYRICPIGAHVDHNLGKITGFAIDKGIYIAYVPSFDGTVKVTTIQFDVSAEWDINSVPGKRQADWADHLRGATIALASRYSVDCGLCAVIDGELPIGGLSSSAAVIIAFLSALCSVNDISVSAEELVIISKEAENNYVGVSCGKLDQSCEVYSRKNHLLYMDLLDDSYELIPENPVMKPYEFAIFFSGLERSLVSSKYNMRADEARSAAYALMAYAGIEYGKFEEANLRYVPYEAFLMYKDRLPESFAKRAEHWFTENIRVEAGAEAWKNGDIHRFGTLSFESGKSSIDNWETGSPELIELYNIMTETEGIYGGRFSGAGFKGCALAIINPEYRELIFRNVEERYLRTFPQLKGKYSSYVCHSADGVKFR